MKTRRQVLVGGATMTAGLALSGCGMSKKIESVNSYKTSEPRRGLVIWFSQTGNTERMGRTIADAWIRQGVAVDCGDIRDVDIKGIPSYDLIVAGSPVFYYEAPEYIRNWLRAMPRVEGVPAGAFATYGGRGHNQHNTACSLLEIMVEKGGVPAGLETFGNMSTFAPTWSALGSEERVLRFSHLPDEETFRKARHWAESILKRVAQGESLTVNRRITRGDLVAGSLSIGLTKWLIGRHEIRPETCINCGICVEKCPVDAIDLDLFTVNRPACVACMGCINNCPVGAFDMTFLGKPVYGFNEFLQRHGIKK